MKKNITLKVNESFLRRCRHHAVEEGVSLSTWVENQIAQVIIGKESLRKSKDKALIFLENGFKLGGKPLSRDDIYER